MMPAGGVSHRKTPADKVFFLLKKIKDDLLDSLERQALLSKLIKRKKWKY